MALPPQIPPNPTGQGFPPVLKWAVALMVIGGISEWLYRAVSPGAGYALVALVLMGYAAVPEHLTNINTFFANVGRS